MMATIRDRWPWLLLLAGGGGFLGSVLHPNGDPTLTGDAELASWVGNPLWVPAHLAIMACAVLVVPGLLGLIGSGRLSHRARIAGWVAFGAAIVWVLESVPHLLAATDEDNLLTGRPARFLFGHLMASVIAYPLIGLSLAALAILGGRALAHPALNLLGAAGSVAFGAAPIGVGLLGIDALEVLFTGSILMTAWIAAVGATAQARPSMPADAAA